MKRVIGIVTLFTIFFSLSGALRPGVLNLKPRPARDLANAPGKVRAPVAEPILAPPFDNLPWTKPLHL